VTTTDAKRRLPLRRPARGQLPHRRGATGGLRRQPRRPGHDARRDGDPGGPAAADLREVLGLHQRHRLHRPRQRRHPRRRRARPRRRRARPPSPATATNGPSASRSSPTPRGAISSPTCSVVELHHHGRLGRPVRRSRQQPRLARRSRAAERHQHRPAGGRPAGHRLRLRRGASGRDADVHQRQRLRRCRPRRAARHERSARRRRYRDAVRPWPDNVLGTSDDPAPINDDHRRQRRLPLRQPHPRPATSASSRRSRAGYGDGPSARRAFIDVPNLSPLGSTNNSFAEVLGSLSGSVYFDANANGARDPGEPGLAGVPVSLTGHRRQRRLRHPLHDDRRRRRLPLRRPAPAGSYAVGEPSQPPNYVDGRESAGNFGGLIGNDLISAVLLPPAAPPPATTSANSAPPSRARSSTTATATAPSTAASRASRRDGAS